LSKQNEFVYRKTFYGCFKSFGIIRKVSYVGREVVENPDAKVVDNVSIMYLATVKHSRVENNFSFGSLGRVYCGRPKAEGKLQYAANLCMNKICPNPRNH
jgi:hypothetical protein